MCTVGHEIVLEHAPTLVLILFHQSVIPTFPEIKKKIFTVLYGFTVYFFDGLWPLEMVSLQPSASTLILTSLQFCVFSIPLGTLPRSRAGKQQFEALPQ